MGMNVGSLGDKLRGLACLKDHKKTLEADLEAAKEQIKVQEKQIVTAMCDLAEEQDLDDPSNFSVAIDGRRYGLSIKTFYSIPAARKSELHDVLRDLGQGELIQEKVDPRTLTKVLASIVEDNGGVLPEAYEALVPKLSTYDEAKITDRKV